ncbi:hypothetical protein [Bradyrhizobium japonicum]|uniref:hypothetical protein n=1 Tax=Bradyrhizobium japonicum TaxID=375 RepID=UPI0027144D9D|nr:hypothetical protein [Bradyrhizobium japonicum]WLB23858.1 hypothetical protein QIH95_44315 [Bradyrhizobium japonicum]
MTIAPASSFSVQRARPFGGLARMREAQNELGKRVDQRAGMPGITATPRQIDLVAFARELGDGWKHGEQRVIHRRWYVRRKSVPHRPSMLDPYIPMIQERFAAAPHLSAVDILSRLETHASGRIAGRQVRTVQVKNWRSNIARQLICSAELTLSIDARSVSGVPIPTSVLA